MKRECTSILFAIMLSAAVAAQTTVTTSGGTTNKIPLFTGASTIGNSNISQSNNNIGIGTASPAAMLHIAAPDNDTESAIAIRQSNSSGFGFDLAVDQVVDGMGYLYAVYGNTRTALEQFDRTNNFVGVGTVAPIAKLHVSDMAKTYNSIGNEYDSNVEIQGLYGGKALGQGASLGFVVPANTDGTNPWEVARLLSSPDNTNSSNANGRIYLQTRYAHAGSWYWNNNLVLTSAGYVGVGTTAPSAPLEVNGNLMLSAGSGASIVFADGTVQSTAFTGVGGTCGGDYAESVNLTGGRMNYEPGDVLGIDPNYPGKFLKLAEAYSTSVAGIYSTKPGVVGRRQVGPKGQDEIPMAMIGIVPVKATAENGAIRPGDLLVSSSMQGYAMRGTDRSRMLGAVLGKAIGSLNSGVGVIEVLVTLQ